MISQKGRELIKGCTIQCLTIKLKVIIVDSIIMEIENAYFGRRFGLVN